MFSWPSALIELLLIGAVLAALARQSALRATVARAPRRLRLGVGVIGVVWGTSQFAEITTATYPFMSWHMYGESRANAPVNGYRLLGYGCLGETEVLPTSGRGLGRRPVLWFGLKRAYDTATDVTAPPAERTAAMARTDSLLSLVLDTWNGRKDARSLCAVDLQQVTIAASDIGHAPLPAYRTVRRYEPRR